MKFRASIGALTFVCFTAHAGSWSDLWYRPDQQGERALRSGNPKEAASLYTDPRRQAYAQMKAGEYAEAAQRLAPLSDAESQYNRGNALARSGDLSSALTAYEDALKHSDLDPSLRQDAEKNRDLVARQLQQQQKPPSGEQSKQSSAADKQQGTQSHSADTASKSGDSSSSPAAQASKSQQGSQSAAQGAPGSAQSQDAAQGKEAGQDNPPGTSQRADQTASGARRADNPAADADAAQRAGPEQPGKMQAGTERSDQSADAQAQAQAKNSAGADRTAGSDALAPADAIPKSQTEQQLALNQWLRQIPDDPGGLLRRKFLIEHLMKQQGVQP